MRSYIIENMGVDAGCWRRWRWLVAATRTVATAGADAAPGGRRSSRSARWRSVRTACSSPPIGRRRRSTRSTSARRPPAARRGRRTSTGIDQQIAVDARHRCEGGPGHRSRRAPEDAERVHLGHARDGRRREAGASARRRRRQDRGRRARRPEDDEGHAAERAGGRRTGQRNPRMESITDMAFVDGKLVVAGLSNEEFASKLRTVPYPFAAVDAGTSVEIYHGNHGQFETRSPVISFVPYKIEQHAAPDRRLHLHAAREVPGVEPRAGREGHGHDDRRARQPQSPDRHDRVQEGRQGLPAHRQHEPRRDEGRRPTASRRAPGITARVASETGGVGFEAVASLKGVEQLDLLDAQRAIVLTRAGGGALVAAGGGAAVGTQVREVHGSWQNGTSDPGKRDAASPSSVPARVNSLLLALVGSLQRCSAHFCAAAGFSSTPRPRPST